MTDYVALLRGIAPMNPNMKNERLREVFEKLGFTKVRTVISSGNVLFQSKEADARRLEALIERALETELGFHSATIIRTKEQFEALTKSQFFADIEDVSTSRCNITFLKFEPRHIPQLPRQAHNKDSTVLGIKHGAVFSIVDITKTKTPDLMRWLEKEFGQAITTRTWKTVNRIVQRFNS